MTTNNLTTEGSKILIVDDKQENLELLSQILEAEGYEIAFAMDGEKAIQIATLYLPDLILLDVMMPGIDGFETCRKMKALHDLTEIPIIFVTGKAGINDVVEAFNLGAVDYVTKPIRHEEIVARVATHLQLQALILLRDNLISQLREQNRDLEKVSKVKDDQLEKSQQFSHLGELVGELTHEISSPLGVINTAMSNLSEQKTGMKQIFDEQKMTRGALDDFLNELGENVDIVLSSLNHAVQVVNSFRKVIVGEFSQTKTNFDIQAYLQDISQILLLKLKQTPHQLLVDCPEKIFMNAESGAISQVLINLVNNALLHAFSEKKKGIISIKIYEADTKVVFEVSDDGVGVSEEKQSKMFDKYFTTRQGEGSSGLGLYIVNKLVTNNLGGEISLKSVEGVGTCYTIVLPNGIAQ